MIATPGSHRVGIHPISREYMVIAGIPTDLAGANAFDMLADPRMLEEIDPETPTQLRPVCSVVGVGLAFPARRLVAMGGELEVAGGVDVSFQSSCQSDYSGPVDALIEQLTF